MRHAVIPATRSAQRRCGAAGRRGAAPRRRRPPAIACRRAGSRSSHPPSAPVPPRRAPRSAPPAARSMATWSVKLPVCGPTAMAQPRRAGSSGFCPPPGGSRLRPTKAMPASRYHSPSSPSVSATQTPSAGGAVTARTVAAARGNGGAAFRVARGDDRQQPRMVRREHAMGGEDQRLLARMRAGGEPDRPPGQQLPQPPQFRRVDRQRRRGELQIARLAHPAAAEGAQPVGVGLRCAAARGRTRPAPAAPAPAHAATAPGCARTAAR